MKRCKRSQNILDPISGCATFVSLVQRGTLATGTSTVERLQNAIMQLITDNSILQLNYRFSVSAIPLSGPQNLQMLELSLCFD